jgi:ferrochelatase
MPRYTISTQDTTTKNTSCGILIANLGTPDSTSTADVRRYLAEFLWDPRIVERPRWIWWLILNGIILRLRPGRAAKAYKKIWTDQGSPLMVHTMALGEQLKQPLDLLFNNDVHVEVCMRYGEPSIKNGLRALREKGVEHILILPLYPQYSATTTASIYDAVNIELQHWRFVPEVRYVNQYYADTAYICALAQSVEQYQQQHGKADQLIMSFHGLPKRYSDAGDPYFLHCQKTAQLLAEQLKLNENEWKLTFQSRFGPEEWLQPYTDKTLESLAQAGCKHIQLICPGFATDCLETLEEIAMENRDKYHAAGGKKYEYIPALNASTEHVNALTELIRRHASNWLSL